MFIIIEIVLCVCAVLCLLKMAQKVSSGRGNTSTSTVHVISNVLLNPEADIQLTSSTANPAMTANNAIGTSSIVDFDVEELIQNTNNLHQPLPVMDPTDLDNVLSLLGTGEQGSGLSEAATSINIEIPPVEHVETEVAGSDRLQNGINSSATKNSQERPPHRISILSLSSASKSVPQSSVGSTSGSVTSAPIRNNTETNITGASQHQPREDDSNVSVLRTLLTKKISLPALLKPSTQVNKGKQPLGRRQVAKKSSGGNRNVGPFAGSSNAALPAQAQINDGPVAGCSSAVLPGPAHCGKRQAPITIPSDSDSESEFAIFSQEDDRQLLCRFKKRCRKVDTDYESGVALLQGAEDALRHAEANFRGVEENIRRLDEERQRLEDELRRAEEEMNRCRSHLEEQRGTLKKAENKRRLMRRMFDR